MMDTKLGTKNLSIQKKKLEEKNRELNRVTEEKIAQPREE